MGKNIKEIAKIFSDNNDPVFISDFLSQILTANEIKEVGDRWESVKMLYAGYSQREIAKKLGMSLCKITRGAKELKKPNNAFKKVLEKKGNKND